MTERLCITCKKAAAPNRSRCQLCLERSKQVTRSYRERHPSRAQDSERRHRAKKKAAGLCSCNAPAAPGKRHCHACLEHRRLDNHRRRQSRAKSGMCRSCGAEANGRSYCKRCLARISERHWALREEVLNAYGAKCACCGESELRFLQIDHIHDDGSKHRAELGAASQTMLRWIKKNGFPKDRLRVLCANCNLGRHLNGGVCPHQIRE